MKYKHVSNLIIVFSLIALISKFDNYYSLLNWYGGNVETLIKNLFPYKIIELFVLILCFIGGIIKNRYVPLLGIIYIRAWLFYSITLLNKYLFDPPTLKVVHYSWADPFYFNNVFFIDWVGVVAYILLSVTCIVGVIMLIKDKYFNQT